MLVSACGQDCFVNSSSLVRPYPNDKAAYRVNSNAKDALLRYLDAVRIAHVSLPCWTERTEDVCYGFSIRSLVASSSADLNKLRPILDC